MYADLTLSNVTKLALRACLHDIRDEVGPYGMKNIWNYSLPTTQIHIPIHEKMCGQGFIIKRILQWWHSLEGDR